MRLFFRKQKPADAGTPAEPAPEGTVEPAHGSAISAGTSVIGNIDCEGDIVIDGTLRGSLRAQGLTVGVDGAIEGEVFADEMTVRGAIKGPIHARHIHLESGAEVEGDITTETIAIDTGARLTGAVWQGGQQPQGDHYAQPVASSWDSAIESASRSLLAARPRINGSSR